MKHTLFAVLATTALTLSAPAFAAGNYNSNGNSNGNAVEHPGTNGSGTNGSPAEMNQNGSTRGSSSEVNSRNCLPQAQFRSMSPQAQARLKSQGISVCPAGTNGQSGGAMHNGSPSGSSQEHYGNFDKNK